MTNRVHPFRHYFTTKITPAITGFLASPSDYPPVPSQGKNLNILKGAHLGTFPEILFKGKI
ncbi:hypothetical protein [Cylindrospermopsis raciborskii]|uniref:hypothetical protein n=1 Tax=Cylindrospermopsis raciborskii TaxID=77022 RepID=UPI000C9E40DD|nr:hypothetical protein [Cylindrospermopsis raciborskii]